MSNWPEAELDVLQIGSKFALDPHAEMEKQATIAPATLRSLGVTIY